jgi:Mce-associated membrane protein
VWSIRPTVDTDADGPNRTGMPGDEKPDQGRGRPQRTRQERPGQKTPRLGWAAWGVRGATAGLAVGLAVGALVAAVAYSLSPSTLSDEDRSAAVGSARTTLESLLSYRGATFDAHVAEVTPRLASPFKEQFGKVASTDIKPMAVENGAVVQAKVYEAGVMDSSGAGGDGSTVRVLAFVNQATTTTAQKTPAIDQNRVIATMKRVGDRWLVSDLSAF